MFLLKQYTFHQLHQTKDFNEGSQLYDNDYINPILIVPGCKACVKYQITNQPLAIFHWW